MLSRPFIWAFCLTLAAIVNLTALPLAELQTDNEFVVGEATAYGVSIAERIASAYKLILIGIVFLSAGFFLIRKFETQLEKHPLISILDKLVPFSILLLALSFFHPPLIESAQLVLFISVLVCLSGSKRLFKTDFENQSFWLVLGLVFICNYWLFHSALIGGLSSLLFWGFAQRVGLQKKVTKFAAFLFTTLPIIAFLIIESTLILNQRGVFLQSYWLFLIVWIIAFLLTGYVLVRKSDNWNDRFVFNRVIPLSLVSIGIIQCYSPLIVQSNEMFEAANQLNPVMQAQLYGEIPLVNNLSSHLFSDFFWVSIYGKLNGYHSDASILIYSDFNYILALLCVYFFVKRISSNATVAVMLLLLLPCAYFVIPFYYSYTLVPVTFFFIFVKENKSGALFNFFLSTFILVFWRLDIAVSLISALVIFIPVWYYFNSKDRKHLLRWTLIFGLMGIFLIGLFISLHPLEFKQATAYFGANQAHGLSALTNQASNTFYLSYYLLPALVVGVLLHTLFTLSKNTNKALSAVILILGLFYIFNLQRGLVRHSFIEYNDTQINSFAWLILLLKSFSFVYSKSKTKFISSAIISCSLIALFFSVQLDNGRINVMLRGTRFSLKDIPQLKAEKINRVIENPEFQQKHAALILFLQKNLKKDQTFIDFSNNSLLYFYSGKNVPSYFDQYLQNTVTGKLQRINLKTLQKTDAPFVVFSQTPESVLDHTDNIPNKVRYFEITNFIYNNYEPWKKIGSYRLWKKRGLKNNASLEDYPVHPESWNLGLLPYFWKANKEERFNASKNTVRFNSSENRIVWKNKLSGLEFLELKIDSKNEQTLTLMTENVFIQFSLKSGSNRYRIPLGCSENLQLSTEKSIQLIFGSEGKIENVRIIKLQHH